MKLYKRTSKESRKALDHMRRNHSTKKWSDDIDFFLEEITKNLSKRFNDMNIMFSKKIDNMHIMFSRKINRVERKKMNDEGTMTNSSMVLK